MPDWQARRRQKLIPGNIARKLEAGAAKIAAAAAAQTTSDRVLYRPRVIPRALPRE
jgi:hypothetical protein